MDLMVVGGGVIGLFSALRLSQRKHDVCVVERAEPGGEATWASAGILGAQSETSAPGPMLDLCVRSRELYARVAEELPGIGYARCGALHVAFAKDEAAALRGQQAWQSAAGLRAELVRHERAQLALWLPDEGIVDNRRLTAALRAALRDTRIARASAVRLRFLRDRLEGVETDREFFPARTAVIAAGAWSAQIEGAGILPEALKPVRGQMIGYAAQPPEHVLFGAGGYAVPRLDRVLVGATVEDAGFDRSITAEGRARMQRVAARLLPELALAQPDDHWAGLRPGSRDGLPLLGRTHRDVVVATGHFRNGILLAPVTAEIVADLVEGESPDLPEFAPDRLSLRGGLLQSDVR